MQASDPSLQGASPSVSHAAAGPWARCPRERRFPPSPAGATAFLRVGLEGERGDGSRGRGAGFRHLRNSEDGTFCSLPGLSGQGLGAEV